MTGAAQPVCVTPELLQRAWRARRRAHWPATFDACMADDMLRRLVRAEAVRLALALRNSWPRAGRAGRVGHNPAAPSRPATPTPARLRAPALRDMKRAAAGDASDD